jgi:hypothetical protein
LKASRVVYDFYWSFVDPHWLADRDKEVEFYRRRFRVFKKETSSLILVRMTATRRMFFEIARESGRR